MSAQRVALRARARSVLHEQVLEPASGTRADDRWPKAAAATATKDDDRGSTATKKKRRDVCVRVRKV